jgi:hypothetical protein
MEWGVKMSATVLSRRPLAANEPYTQDKQDRFNDARPVGGVRGLIYADQAGTLCLEESDDAGVTWSTTTTVAVSAAVTAKLDWTSLTKRWYRFRYVNGAIAQVKFVLIQQTRGMELVSTELTGSITPTHVVASVGVVSTQILAANVNRKYALIINDSDTVIYLKIGEAAVLNQGIRLNPNGGAYEMSSVIGDLVTGAINGISSAANKTVLATEGV